MTSQFTALAYLAWLALGLVWLPGYFKSKRISSAPNLVLQISNSILLTVGFVLLFNPGIHPLSGQITPRNAIFGMTGNVLDLAGVGFAIWARLALGTNWSGIVATTKQGHELIQTGPYAIVRHPIYAGMVLAAAGTALTIGTLASYAGLAALLVALMIRVSIEEKLMGQQFGETHQLYQRQTRKLVPFVW
jgi:protein-S-isoprenylcysteine O-methyltransferase Ste14